MKCPKCGSENIICFLEQRGGHDNYEAYCDCKNCKYVFPYTREQQYQARLDKVLSKLNIEPHKGRYFKYQIMLGLKISYRDGKLWLYSKFQNKSHNSDWCKKEISLETVESLIKDLEDNK